MTFRMRRSIITDEISQDFLRAVEVAHRHGLDGVEIRSLWEKSPHELSDEEVRQVASICRNYGMSIPCLAAPLFKCDLDDDRACDQHLQMLSRLIAVAQRLGTPFLRGFTFWSNGSFEDALPRILKRIQPVDAVLRGSGVTLLLEHDPSTFASSSQRLEQIVRSLGLNTVQALWDPGNNMYVPDAEAPFPDSYERLRPYIRHVHIKDVRRLPDGNVEACRLGDGEVPYEAIFRRLLEEGYNGWLSLETHYRLRTAISEELMALPKGSQFSAGGEEASIESLERWNTMWQALGLLE